MAIETSLNAALANLNLRVNETNGGNYEIGSPDGPKVTLSRKQLAEAKDGLITIGALSAPFVGAARFASSHTTKLLEPAEKFGDGLLKLTGLLGQPLVSHLFGEQVEKSIVSLIPENKQGVKNG